MKTTADLDLDVVHLSQTNRYLHQLYGFNETFIINTVIRRQIQCYDDALVLGMNIL